MIPNPENNIWEHSQTVRDLYARRAEGFGEMDAAAQAAEMLAPFILKAPRTMKLLDAGCGSGYLWHSFKKRAYPIEYYGLDYSPSLIDLGRSILPGHGLATDHLICGAIEDLTKPSYDLVALINTLTFCPDFRQPLDRLLETGPQVLVIRDNFGETNQIRWEWDGYLDPGYNHLKAYWNQWSVTEVTAFLTQRGYQVAQVADQRMAGQVELVVGKPYYWSWLLATRTNQAQ